ncbi:MAG: DNA primase [Coprobacillus sp.]|nr:DNA primase [Coprobacillus sp.]
MPGRIDDAVVNELLKHTDIVSIISSYLPTTKKGRNYVAVCPFHDDTSPSLTISPEKQIFRCFACGASGNAISFVSKYEKISYPEAIHKVAEMSDFHDERLEQHVVTKPVDENKEVLYKCLEDLTSYYQLALTSQEGEAALQYLEERGLDSHIREKFRLGFAPEDGVATCLFLQQRGHSLKVIEDSGVSTMLGGQPVDKNRGRVIFPLCDPDGRVVGYSARNLKNNDEAKYVNTADTLLFHKSSILYNYHNARDSSKMTGYVYIVEGFMDVLALEKVGINCALALMGTALTQNHIPLLRSLNCELRLCLDGDVAGQEASIKASNLLSRGQLRYRIVDSQGERRDLDEILKQEGNDALLAHVSNLLDRLDFALNYYTKTNPLQTNDERKKLIESFLPVLVDLDMLDQSKYISELSKATAYPMKTIEDLVKNYKKEQKQVTPKELMEKYAPDKVLSRRLLATENEILYLMMHYEEAREYYLDKVNPFTDETLREIAEYLLDMRSKGIEIDEASLADFIERSDIDEKRKDSLIAQALDVMNSTRYSPKYSQERIQDLQTTRENEMTKGRFNDYVHEATRGKSESEKSRIYTNVQNGKHREGGK